MEKIPHLSKLPGNLTLFQMADIAKKHRLNMSLPATCFIGRCEFMNSKDRLIYTDQQSGKLVVEQKPVTVQEVRQFIDKHLNKRNTAAANPKSRMPEGVVNPRYVLKFLEKNGKAYTQVYFDKNVLISDMIERWGTQDIMLQEFVIQKTMQACVYRFYRNERNVYKAECIISNKSINQDKSAQNRFDRTYQDCKYEQAGLGPSNAVNAHQIKLEKTLAAVNEREMATTRQSLATVPSSMLRTGSANFSQEAQEVAQRTKDATVPGMMQRTQSVTRRSTLRRLPTSLNVQCVDTPQVNNGRQSMRSAFPEKPDSRSESPVAQLGLTFKMSESGFRLPRRGSANKVDEASQLEVRFQNSSDVHNNLNLPLPPTTTLGLKRQLSQTGFGGNLQFPMTPGTARPSIRRMTSSIGVIQQIQVKETINTQAAMLKEHEELAIYELMEKAQKTDQKGKRKDARNLDELFMRKIQQSFGMFKLQDLFTVEVEYPKLAQDKEQQYSDKKRNATLDNEDTKNTNTIKCMPSAYPQAIKSINDIYKAYSQMFVDSAKEGVLNQFVCDFLQDEYGRFHFLKLAHFQTDGKPDHMVDWVVSTMQTDKDKEQRERLARMNKCHANILCAKIKDAVVKKSNLVKGIVNQKSEPPQTWRYKYEDLMQQFENSCRKNDLWYDQNTMVFPKQATRLITIYSKEISIASQTRRHENREANDVSLFYPLLTFPDRSNKLYTKFESKMRKYEDKRTTVKHDQSGQLAEPMTLSRDLSFEQPMTTSKASTMNHRGSATPLQQRSKNLLKSSLKIPSYSGRQLFEKQLPRVQEESLNVTGSSDDSDDSDLYSMNSYQTDPYYAALRKDKKSVCWHCSKLIDLFIIRSQVITFQSSHQEGGLRFLRSMQNANWTEEDIDFVLELYKSSPQRLKNISDNFQFLEKRNNERLKKQKIRRRRAQFQQDIQRKTASCFSREEATLALRKRADFLTIQSKMSRTGCDFFSLTESEQAQLENGPEQKKHELYRYGKTPDLNQSFTNRLTQDERIQMENDPSTSLNPVKNKTHANQDSSLWDLRTSFSPGTLKREVEQDLSDQMSQDRTVGMKRYYDVANDRIIEESLDEIMPTKDHVSRNPSSASKNLSIARTFPDTSQPVGGVVVQSARASLGRHGSVEQKVWKNNRPRPMTTSSLEQAKMQNKTERGRQSPMLKAGTVEKVKRNSSAKQESKRMRPVTSLSDFGQKIDGKKTLGRRSIVHIIKPEFRLQLKKNSTLKQSSFLQSIRNQNIGAELAMNPYAKELEYSGHIKFKPIKVKMISSHKKHTPVPRRSLATMSDLNEQDEVDASTQPPHTEAAVHEDDDHDRADILQGTATATQIFSAQTFHEDDESMVQMQFKTQESMPKLSLGNQTVKSKMKNMGGGRYLNTVMKASAPTKTSERTSSRLYKTQSMLSFAKASEVANTRNNQESLMTHGSEPKLLYIKKNKSKRKIININSKASKRQGQQSPIQMTTRQVKTLKIKRRPTQEYDENGPTQNEHYIEETNQQ